MKVVNIIKPFFLLLLITSLPNIGYSFTINAQHPRIFINSGNIETIKARSGVANQTHSEYESHRREYLRVKEVADRYSSSDIRGFDGLNKARAGLASAFVYMMEGGSRYKSQAQEILNQIPSLGNDDKSYYGFMSACIVYDWLYNDLTNIERTSYTNSIKQFISSSSWAGSYNSFDPYYHDRKYVTSLYALSGQAIYNEDPETANTYINRSLAVYERMMIAQKEIAEDGFIYPIGQSGYYDESGWQPVLRVLAGLKFAGVTGPEIDAIEVGPIEKTAYGEIYSLVKDNYLISHNDGYNSGDKPWRRTRSPEGPFYSAILAKLHEGEEIGKITNYLQSKYDVGNISEQTFTFLGSILFNNKTRNVPGNVINDLPLTKIFDDTVLVYRTGWNGLSTNNNEIIFNFTAEKQANGHTHYAKGHFDIWRGYDPLTFTSGNYSNTSYSHYLYYKDSLAANTMLIRNPNEETGGGLVDGGQLFNGGEGISIGMQKSSAWRQIGHTEEGGASYTGKIKHANFNDDHFYAYYHYPSAYSSSKVDDLSRSVARLGDYFIILDRVNGPRNTAFEKKWLLHSIGTPTIVDNGSWNGGTPLTNGGTPNQTSSNAKELKVTEGDSSLFIKSILPADTLIHRVGGNSAYRWYSYINNTNYSQGAPDHGNHGNWRIEIESSGNEDDIFLTVLHPTSTSGSMASTVNISGVNYVGVQVNDATTKVAVFSNSINEQVKQISYSFQVNSEQRVEVLVADLASGTYNISRNNSLVSTRTVTDETGSLYFDIPAGGRIEVIRSGNVTKSNPPIILVQ